MPSLLSAVVTRIEVKDPNDAADMAGAQAVFDGITIEGPTIREMPAVELLSGFDEQVALEALKRMDGQRGPVPFSKMIVGPGQGTRQGRPLSLPLRRHQGGLGADRQPLTVPTIRCLPTRPVRPSKARRANTCW